MRPTTFVRAVAPVGATREPRAPLESACTPARVGVLAGAGNAALRPRPRRLPLVKFALMWGLALGWFVALAFVAVDALTSQDPLIAWGRIEWLVEVLAGIGALTVGIVPVVVAATVHHLHRRRLRSRLEKQKARIEKQLARLDERQGRTPAAHSSRPASQN